MSIITPTPMFIPTITACNHNTVETHNSIKSQQSHVSPKNPKQNGIATFFLKLITILIKTS